MIRTDYLIVGNSAGGIGAVEAIREVDKAGSLLIISEEPYPAYSRPLISKYLAGERTLEEMLFRPPGFCSQNNVTCLLNTKVKRLEPELHTAELDGGDKIVWKKLLLAPGGVPVVPGIEGIGKKGVFTFTTLDDAKAIADSLCGISKAAVIGGGLIGVSVTEALAKRGIEVTLIEMKDRILNTILDEPSSLIAEEVFREAGVRIITGRTVARINGEDTVESVVLDDREEIRCGLVVVAIGVSPRIELAAGTTIEVNRGIVVDRRMATSCPDVYACGDVVEAYDFVHGVNGLTPIWPNAYLGGRFAGFNMAGISAQYPGGTAMNSISYFGLHIVAAGVLTPPVDDGCEMLVRQDGSTYRKLVLKDGLVVGMVFVRDIERSGIVFSLMREQVDAGSFKEALLADDFGLVSLPRELWQERLGTPTSKLNTEPAVLVGAAMKSSAGEPSFGLGGLKNERTE